MFVDILKVVLLQITYITHTCTQTRTKKKIPKAEECVFNKSTTRWQCAFVHVEKSNQWC